MRRYHVVDLLQDVYFLPHLFVRRLLNFLLSDLADTFYYTKGDIKRRPFLFATLGWLFVYVVFAMLSPALLFVVSIIPELNFLTFSMMYGSLFWLWVVMLGIDVGIGFMKRLTKRIWKYVKSVVGLHSEPPTDDYNKSAKICRL
jgi:hypothetical protein